MVDKTSEYAAVPPDNLKRNLTIAHIDKDQSLQHIGLVGDTYTITVTGAATAGRSCLFPVLAYFESSCSIVRASWRTKSEHAKLPRVDQSPQMLDYGFNSCGAETGELRWREAGSCDDQRNRGCRAVGRRDYAGD